MNSILGTRGARLIRWVVAMVLTVSIVPAVLSTQQPPGPVTDTQATNMPMPAVIHSLKPHEVVEQIIGQRHQLLLSDAQFAELTTLHQAVRDGQPITEPTGSAKPPFQRTVVITTPEQALAKAFTILTPQQQHQSLMLFEKAGRP